MSDLNGDTKVVLFRLNLLTEQMGKIETQLNLVHDKIMGLPPQCPSPGLCVDLRNAIREHEGEMEEIIRSYDERLKTLEKQEVRIVTICGVITFVVAVLIKFI